MPSNIQKTIVDVGACDTAVFTSQFINEGWESIMIEPQPSCAESLRKLYPQCKVIEKACGTERCKQKLFLGKDSKEVATLSTSHDPWMDQVRSDDYIVVDCDNLTNILKEVNCPNDIGILKIDCESFDPDVIEGLDLFLYRPMFVITEEYYWEPQKLKNKYSKLEENDYVLLGYEGYNSVWRKRSSTVRYTDVLLRDFWRMHGLDDKSIGFLNLIGPWSGP